MKIFKHEKQLHKELKKWVRLESGSNMNAVSKYTSFERDAPLLLYGHQRLKLRHIKFILSSVKSL